MTPRVPVSPQVIKECSGSVQLLQSSPEIDLRCFDASSDVSGGDAGGTRGWGEVGGFLPLPRMP